MTIAFVLVAGGSGTRLKAAVPKAFVDLEGKTLLERSFATLQSVGRFTQAIVVAPADWCEAARLRTSSILREGLELKVVAGGEERQHSVSAGLRAVHASTEIVVIHDAARPFATVEQISACIDAAREHGGATLALEITDTVKEVGEQGRVLRTLDRTRLRLVQTPQAFRFALLRDAHARAEHAGSLATDDAALVEALGAVVMAIPGDAGNLKVTTPEDLSRARWLLGQGRR